MGESWGLVDESSWPSWSSLVDVREIENLAFLVYFLKTTNNIIQHSSQSGLTVSPGHRRLVLSGRGRELRAGGRVVVAFLVFVCWRRRDRKSGLFCPQTRRVRGGKERRGRRGMHLKEKFYRWNFWPDFLRSKLLVFFLKFCFGPYVNYDFVYLQGALSNSKLVTDFSPHWLQYDLTYEHLYCRPWTRAELTCFKISVAMPWTKIVFSLKDFS